LEIGKGGGLASVFAEGRNKLICWYWVILLMMICRVLLLPLRCFLHLSISIFIYKYGKSTVKNICLWMEFIWYLLLHTILFF